jgi:hypothetical protein
MMTVRQCRGLLRRVDRLLSRQRRRQEVVARLAEEAVLDSRTLDDMRGLLCTVVDELERAEVVRLVRETERVVRRHGDVT